VKNVTTCYHELRSLV